MEQRRKGIVELINREGKISFANLKNAFPNVSEMTLRNDLKYLDQTNQIIRVFGGAKSINYVVGTDDLIALRMERNKDKKRIIAKKTLQLIRPNISIFLDSGSTLTELSECIPDQELLIYTSGINCIQKLAALKKPSLHMLGGKLFRPSMCVAGATSLRELENLHFNMAFLGTNGYNANQGFCCGSEEDRELKSTAIRKADQVVLLMDSSKVGLSSTYTVCGLKDVDFVVSDDEISPDFAAECAKNNVSLL